MNLSHYIHSLKTFEQLRISNFNASLILSTQMIVEIFSKIMYGFLGDLKRLVVKVLL